MPIVTAFEFGGCGTIDKSRHFPDSVLPCCLESFYDRIAMRRIKLDDQAVATGHFFMNSGLGTRKQRNRQHAEEERRYTFHTWKLAKKNHPGPVASGMANCMRKYTRRSY